MELRAGDVALRHSGDDCAAVIRRRDHAGLIGRREVIGVGEIHMRALRPALQQGMIGKVERVPAELRQFERGVLRFHAAHFAAQPAEPVMHAMFVAGRGEQLHAHANTEERRAALHDRVVECFDHAGHGAQPRRAIAEGALARQHDAIGFAHDIGVGRDDDVGAALRLMLERFGGRAQIARPVIDDGDFHSAAGWRRNQSSSASSRSRPEARPRSTQPRR